ncbi:MAG: hypothetical protein ACPGYV_13245 [Phycisphaeraceae bacterium]
MPVFTILFGVALMAVGVGTYAGSAEPSLPSFLLQMIIGLLAIALGVGSIVKKEMRMHLMHGAVLLAVLGVVVPTVKFVGYLVNLEQDQQMQLLRMVLTVAFSGAYVFAAVQSFRAARRARTNLTPAPPSEPANEPETTPPT